jgi:hypothetical protein
MALSKRKKTIMTVVLAAVLALAVAVPALAATETTPAASTATCGQGYGGMRGLGAGGQMSVAISDLLGMEPADLSAARQDGRSLAEIAQSRGISTDTLISGMLEAHKAALADAVADGRITQERADLMLQNMSDRISDRIDDTEAGPPAGRGDRGGHGRGSHGACGICLGTAQ